MNELYSVVKWIPVENENELPDLGVEVLVITKDGNVGYGQRSEVFVYEMNENNLYRRTDKKKIEWGIDGEYWCKIDVILWAKFPESPLNKTQ